jgi:hypothetical protein
VLFDWSSSSEGVERQSSDNAPTHWAMPLKGQRNMTTGENKAMFIVVLHKRVILKDGLTFDAEREVSLPIAPFVGLHLYHAEWVTPGCDESDDDIEKIAFDLKTGQLICYLPEADYRPEHSGCDDWTEEEMRQHYRDWNLERHNCVGKTTIDE